MKLMIPFGIILVAALSTASFSLVSASDVDGRR